MTMPTHVGGTVTENGASSTITYQIDFPIAGLQDGDYVVVALENDATAVVYDATTYNAQTWTLLATITMPSSSRSGQVFGRFWHTGDSTSFFYRKNRANADGVAADIYRGVDPAKSIIVGTVRGRQTSPADTSSTTTINGITTSTSDTLAVAIAMEATSAAESGAFLNGPTIPSGWTQTLYRQQTGTINTILFASKPMGTPGDTGSPVFTYQNTQANNGGGVMLGLPGYVVASNVPPTAGFTYAAEDLAVQFTDTSTDSDGTVTSRSWDFGDGTTSTATSPQHTYTAPGTYTVALTVTDNSGANNSTSQSITVYGLSAMEWEVSRGSWKEVIVQIRKTDNSDQRIQDIAFVPGTGPSLSQQLKWYGIGKKMFIAHRGLSGNYPEETLYAYWAASLLGYQALEISVQKSADGTFWCFHDNTTTRTTGVTGTISAMTDAQIAALNNNPVGTDNQSQPARPTAKLTDVLAVYGGKRLIFIEDKTYANTDAVLALMDANGGTDWYVWKQAGPGTKFSQVATKGYKSWGYFFDSDMASGYSTKWQQWDFIGLDFNSSDSTLASAMSQVNDPSRFINHIIPNATQRDRMLALGVRGLMVSNGHGVTPVV